MTDTTNELAGYLGDCCLCDESIMSWDDHGEIFDGLAHTACLEETKREINDYEREAYDERHN